MIMMDCSYLNGFDLGAESESSQATGAGIEDNLPIVVMKDKPSKTLSTSFVLANCAGGSAI